MPHLLYMGIGFAPAAKSGAYRLKSVANLFAEHGWDITVLTLEDDSWLREYGLDLSLLEGLSPRVGFVKLPLARADLEPDLRRWSRWRARFPDRWAARHKVRTLKPFPEAVFGLWRPDLERAALAVHDERPVDLVMVSPAPYTQLSAALHLHLHRGVPYVVDFRDGWSIDVIKGTEAFPLDSRAGAIERAVLERAEQVWTVNTPIRDWYASRYPDLVDRLRIVRNGFDITPAPLESARTGRRPLVFGYLGTINIAQDQMVAMLDGWRLARASEPLLADSRLEFRGHFGAGHAKGASAHARLITQRAGDAVSYGGPVAKQDVDDVYGGWDALVLALVGGRYVTSGKVYEYVATGLPIVSVHQKEHAATEVLQGHPMWAPAADLTPEAIAAAFVAAAHSAVEAGADEHRAARIHAERFQRRALLAPAVAEVAGLVEGGSAS